MPLSRRSATRRPAREVARVDVGHQAVLGAVGQARPPRRRRRRRPPGRPGRRSLVPRMCGVLRARPPSTVGLVVVARPGRAAEPPVTRRRRPRRAPLRPARPPCRGSCALTSGPTVGRRRRGRGPPAAPRIQLGEPLRELVGAAMACTMKRFAAVQAEPPLRIFATMAPSTASSEVGVGQHEERRVAAELHRRADHRPGGVRQQDPADLGRAGERHLADQRVVEQAPSDSALEPRRTG